MGNVSVPHFGVHLTREAFDEVKKRCIEHNIEFIDKPYLRFEGTDLEQETMFIADPHGNAMEIKTMKNPEESLSKFDFYNPAKDEADPQKRLFANIDTVDGRGLGCPTPLLDPPLDSRDGWKDMI